MTTLEIYRSQYEECRIWYSGAPASKYVWVASRVFDLCTYDKDLDESFVKNIIEVCKVILEERNFEYIIDSTNYTKYILVCQLLRNFNWIEWGSSIRGAWFERDDISKDILGEVEWWDDEHHIIDKVPFSIDNIKTLIEFMEE